MLILHAPVNLKSTLMKTRHQNLGQWRAMLFQQTGQYLLKICAALPNTNPTCNYQLTPIEHLSSAAHGVVYLLEGGEYLNSESQHSTFLCNRENKTGTCPYKKIIIVGFRPGETRSFLIALIEVKTDLPELDP